MEWTPIQSTFGTPAGHKSGGEAPCASVSLYPLTIPGYHAASSSQNTLMREPATTSADCSDALLVSASFCAGATLAGIVRALSAAQVRAHAPWLLLGCSALDRLSCPFKLCSCKGALPGLLGAACAAADADDCFAATTLSVPHCLTVPSVKAVLAGLLFNWLSSALAGAVAASSSAGFQKLRQVNVYVC